MDKREKLIQKYFDSWLEKDISVLDKCFSFFITYSECYGPEYHGIDQVKKWFRDWNREGTVIRWDIKDFIHQGEKCVVEWYFECDIKNKISGFDGVSIISFDKNDKIVELKEFQSKYEHNYPYN